MQSVTSPRNPLLKEVRKALLNGGLTDAGLCVAEGFHLLDEALRSDCEVSTVLAAESVRFAVESRVPLSKRIRVLELPDNLFRSFSSTETSQGLIALVRPPTWTLEQLFHGRSLVVILDRVQDPGNCGAILRSSEAFGATGVALLKGTVNPYNPKSVRASAGSVFRVPLVKDLDEDALLTAIGQHKIEVYALVPGGRLDIARCPFERPCALVVGSEGSGVSEHLRAGSIEARIPTTGVESLNAAMAAAIALYEVRRQRMVQQ